MGPTPEGKTVAVIDTPANRAIFRDAEGKLHSTDGGAPQPIGLDLDRASRNEGFGSSTERPRMIYIPKRHQVDHNGQKPVFDETIRLTDQTQYVTHLKRPQVLRRTDLLNAPGSNRSERKAALKARKKLEKSMRREAVAV